MDLGHGSRYYVSNALDWVQRSQSKLFFWHFVHLHNEQRHVEQYVVEHRGNGH